MSYEEQNGVHEGSSSEETVRAELLSCKEALRKLEAQYNYLAADFDNYRKRQEKERLSIVRSAQATMLRDILGLIGDFERALQELKRTEEQGNSALSQSMSGVTLIHKNLMKLLEKYGVTEIANYTEFDPAVHEALSQVVREGFAPGQIVEVLEKGYLLRGELLKPALVTVAA